MTIKASDPRRSVFGVSFDSILLVFKVTILSPKNAFEINNLSVTSDMDCIYDGDVTLLQTYFRVNHTHRQPKPTPPIDSNIPSPIQI